VLPLSEPVAIRIGAAWTDAEKAATKLSLMA